MPAGRLGDVGRRVRAKFTEIVRLDVSVEAGYALSGAIGNGAGDEMRLICNGRHAARRVRAKFTEIVRLDVSVEAGYALSGAIGNGAGDEMRLICDDPHAARPAV
jgi:hypothetical protein